MFSLSPDALRQRLRFFASRAQPVRILLTLGSLMAVCGATGHADAVIPLFLGAIASALAETDDSWRGRLRAQLVTLACFAAMAFAVEALFERPLAFVAGLALAAFCLTMLGAIEARYKAIAFATLILAMYAALGMAHHAGAAPGGGREPLLLLAGAAWYGVFSVLWCALWPAQPVQARLVTLFTVLGHFIRFKASLFEPLRGIDMAHKRLSLAQLNAEVVEALNAAKESIFRRIGPRAPTGRIARYRGLYLIAQDVHERASSSHDDYNVLADTFFHSDLLYRCQRVLGLQGLACLRLAGSIARREPFESSTDTAQALADLRSALANERARTSTPEHLALLTSVEAMARNLAQLDGQLAGASEPSARAGRTEMGLFDRSPRSWRDAAARVRGQLARRSPLFRHALRLSIALAAGYAVMRTVDPAQGYWILLTTLFVCQQSYGDTVARMVQRIAGTALGVMAGWALLQLFPQPPVQSAIAVAAGVLFFATRATRYLLATAAVTLLVLMCFNQVGNGGALLVPRLVDTAIGSAIAGLAVLLVLPHWQARRIHELAAAAMRGHAGYLRQIVAQYRAGARDHLDYRLARRNDHNADAALSTAVSEMFREPGHVRPRAGVALRFLIRSHTLLSHLSALGAHRVAVPDSARTAALHDAAEGAADALEALASDLERGAAGGPRDAGSTSSERAALSVTGALADDTDVPARILHTELQWIWLQIDALGQLAREWVQPEGGEKSTQPLAGPARGNGP